MVGDDYRKAAVIEARPQSVLTDFLKAEEFQKTVEEIEMKKY